MLRLMRKRDQFLFTVKRHGSPVQCDQACTSGDALQIPVTLIAVGLFGHAFGCHDFVVLLKLMVNHFLTFKKRERENSTSALT